MSDSQTPYSRYVSRVSDRKKRKLSVDETSKQKWARVEPFDIDLFAPIESQMICSQSSKNECGDLFSAPLPHVKWVNTPPPIKKSNKKTSVTKSEKKSKKNIGSSNSFKKRKSWNVPPVPNMDRTIEEAQQEWYKLMGPEKSSNDVSALSNGSLNISGVQPLNESSPNLNSSENEKKSSEVLKGVVAFVDYKIKNDQSFSDIVELLIMLGAQVENTFNQKVTHVVFHDGSLETYKTAIERKIPLVTSKWVENSHLVHKMMDPFDYAPVDMERYTETQDNSLTVPKCNEQNEPLGHSNITVNNNKNNSISESYRESRSEILKSIKTPKLRKRVVNLDKIMDGLSKVIYDILNDQDGAIVYDTEVVSEDYVPLAIKIIRRYIIPEGKKRKSPSEINDHLIEIEHELKLNYEARKRLRRLLFSSNKDLNNTIAMGDFQKDKENWKTWGLREIGPVTESDSHIYKIYDLYERIDNLKAKCFETESVNTPELRRPVINLDLILKGLSKCVRDSLVDHTSPHLDDDRVCKDFVPLSIQLLRKYIIPKEGENKSPSEINHHLIRIENRMKINFLARQRFRRLLFCENEDLKNNPTVMNGYLSPLPKKSTKSASARLASRKKQKLLLGKQTLHQDNKFKEIEGNPENQTTVTRTIACTGFTKREVNRIKQSIQNLGTFTFQNNVECSTSHLITKSQSNRTLNMLFAMAYGCNIVSENWVYESQEIGRWLPYEQYLISDLSGPVKEFQTRRNTFGSLSKFLIFDSAGSIYISNNCEPSAKHLKQLVRACGGKCTSIVTKANIVVGKTCETTNNIHESWILDCITQGTLLNKDRYMLVSDNIEP